MMKRVAVLGSTGSIGVNSLQVAGQLPDDFKVTALTTHRNVKLLLQQAQQVLPQVVAVTGEKLDAETRQAFQRLHIEVLEGADALLEVSRTASYDLLVNAVVGAIGFLPTLAAVDRGKNVALANKETMVIGGALVNKAASRNRVHIVPIDSEHSAIFQCLWGEAPENVETLLLTGSGGPFRTLPREEFSRITVAQALKHPNWSMGPKITIDSATMMNKALEIIEAHWLFQMPPEKIRVVVHPQSIIHSMVVFKDGSIKAQLGLPDMRVPIQVAMTWPERRLSSWPRLDFSQTLTLHFEAPDPERFKSLALAYAALASGGSAPAVLNAANEVAVRLFLEEKIPFTRITELVDAALQRHSVLADPGAEELLRADAWARNFVLSQC
jgi:1-deoxy-D-xylulose-5-phosphate reductoisomerase